MAFFSKYILGTEQSESHISYPPKSYGSYMQAAVDSLLHAVIDVSSRGNGRDRNINVFVQRRLAL
jgi:hypothetical protein